ncbi:virulence factor [Brevundimonas sp. LM2]|uniref:virulence factor n=1 Tax=Brevundimonas sp. LM2 TaxID=1938605 RepID=UPI000983CB32|nr:virulence factor [Brevundimonas sp. LM2]AQR62601.1 virulence factor [Brevundimonas sp. LM2]
MFAIALDLDWHQTALLHLKSLREAYRDVERTVGRYGFHRVQQSVYVTEEGDLTNLFAAMSALKAMPWFPECVTDIRGFRVEDWSDFTPLMKSNR